MRHGRVRLTPKEKGMIADMIDLPVARAVVAAIGRDAAQNVLRLCADEERCDHETRIRFNDITGSKPEILDRDGIRVLTSIMDLGDDCYWEDGSITMPLRQFPETLAVAMTGRPVSDIIGDHPFFRDMTVACMSVDEAGTVVDIADAGRTLDWIMES